MGFGHAFVHSLMLISGQRHWAVLHAAHWGVLHAAVR